MDDSFPAVEQAVFSVKLGEKRATVVLAQKTSGVLDVDVQELEVWAKRVDLFDGRYDPTNLFFFPLPSGALAIGRLTPNYDVPRSSGRYYFQTLLAAPGVFFRCGANPITLYQMALNTTRFSLFNANSRLKPFELAEKGEWVDQPELRRATQKLGVRPLAVLAQSVLDSIRTAFISDYRAFLVVSCLFGLTPIYWRPELTFAVGVRFRGSVPLRLIGTTVLKDDKRSIIGSTRPFVDLRDVVENNDSYPIRNPWAALIETALLSKRVDYFYRKMAEDYFDYQKNRDDAGFDRVVTPDEIAELGVYWLRGLEDAIEKGENFDDAGDDRSKSSDKKDDSFDSSDSFDAESSWNDWNENEDDEKDEDWGLNGDSWRIDSDDSDERNKPKKNGANGLGEFLFIDESDFPDDEADRIEETERDADSDELSDDSFRRRDAGAGKNEFRRKSDLLDDNLRDLLERIQRSEREEARREAEKSKNQDAENDRKNNRDAENINDRENAQKKNDDPNGKKGGALRPESRAEIDDALRRLQKALRPTLRKKEERKSACDNGSEQYDDFSKNSPFAVLCVEFPNDEAALRRLDSLVASVCEGNIVGLRTLRDFWKEFRAKRDEDVLWRVREEYLNYLRSTFVSFVDDRTTEHLARTTNALDVFDVLIQ